MLVRYLMFFQLWSLQLTAQFSVDLTDSLIFLGNPAKSIYAGEEEIYARNTWDLAWLNDHLLIGSGNSSNHGPAPNAGPVHLLTYDVSSKSFQKGFQLDEEQINAFLMLNDTLFIAGHDAHEESWDFGNYYTFSNSKWTKHRNIPGGLHVYDMAYHNGSYFTVLGTTGRTPSIFKADAAKGPWRELPSPNSYRKYNLFSWQGKLYATSWIEYKPGDLKEYLQNDHVFGKYPIPETDHFFAPLFQLNGDEMEALTQLRGEILFPDTPAAARNKVGRIQQIQAFGGKLYYIGGAAWNDHQIQPFGLYEVQGPTDDPWKIIKRIDPFPEKLLPWPDHPGHAG